MDINTLIGVGSLLLALLCGGGLLYFLIAPKDTANMRSLMGGVAGAGGVVSQSSGEAIASPAGIAAIKKATKQRSKKDKVTLEEKFFQAGLFTKEDREDFARKRAILPVVLGPLLGAGGFFGVDAQFAVLGLVIGAAVGYQAPMSMLDRKIKRRHEEIMFYLPLVIEQVVIGVSSSLDVGPCLQRVCSMADERNSHNPVTELLAHAQQYAKSGVSFDEAMLEVGTLSGHVELKHAFKSLSQVAKHGGEITKQLQELADSVATQRETKIDEKIKKLELEATGPVGMVFFGFIIILLIGFGMNMMKAFQ